MKNYIEKETEKIKRQIGQWNNQVYESNFARNFKIIFVRCKEFYEDEIEEESRQLTRLNTSITKLAAEEIDSEILDPLQAMVKEAQRNVNELKDINRKLKELQNEFFTEIKFIADMVGIAMPEPSEIDLLQDKVQDPLRLVEDYKRENNIQTDPSLQDMLQQIFEGVEPVINRSAGGSEYKKELLDVLSDVFPVSPDEIHINDVYRSYKEYSEMIGRS